MENVIFILGPTAIGKTELAFNLAKKTGGRIVSCDSMLIYKEAEIITSKPTEKMLSQVPHYFVNDVSVEDTYDVFTYYAQALELIRRLHLRHVPVVVCGGTGLYYKVLLDGIFEGASRNEELRIKLQQEAEQKGVLYVYNMLKKVDPFAAEKISPNDLKRVIRGLEVHSQTGVPISQKQRHTQGLWGELAMKIFGLTMKREFLYERINRRVDEMCEAGAVEEVKRLLSFKLSLTAQKIIGIKELKSYIEGEMTLCEAKDMMKRNTRRFAKRQYTWFKKDKRVEWIDVYNRTSESLEEEVMAHSM